MRFRWHRLEYTRVRIFGDVGVLPDAVSGLVLRSLADTQWDVTSSTFWSVC